MNLRNALGVSLLSLAVPVGVSAQAPNLKAAGDELMKSDAAFAKSVADKNREKFLSFIADASTFSGGTTSELHGRDEVMREWAAFFEADGPSLTWAPIKGEAIGVGDVGYTIGRSLLRRINDDGKVIEKRGQYVTVWRKQDDGSWKAVFDTGSTLR